MAPYTGLFSRLSGLFRTGPLPRATPMREMGVSGTSVYGGIVQQRERESALVGAQRWITYADLVTNTSIVAAGTRYMFNLVAYSKWTVEPADDTPEAQAIADFVDSVIDDTTTPWRRIVRRSAGYRFYGFGIQEWTAKRRTEDGKIGLDDIEARPQHTIERWEVDDNGSVQGVWQRAPMGGDLLFLPRTKILYMVDDTLTDSPEGIGLFRNLYESNVRLKRYLELEGRGFERDLRGTPIGRVPYGAIADQVAAGKMTKEDASKITADIEKFVQMQSKDSNTSIVLDSRPYMQTTDSGETFSSAMQYGIELLQGGSVSFTEVGAAIDRVNHEMARIIGVENLLLGDKGGSRALSVDKSQNFYLVVNGSLDEIADGMNKDVIIPICDLNGIKEELRPKLKHSEVSFRTVQEVTTALQQMATAGAVLSPTDPAIDDVRDLLGISRQPEPDAATMMLNAGIGEDVYNPVGALAPVVPAAPGAKGPKKPGAQNAPPQDARDPTNLGKFNPHHGKGGRFATSDEAGAVVWLESHTVSQALDAIAEKYIKPTAHAAASLAGHAVATAEHAASVAVHSHAAKVALSSSIGYLVSHKMQYQDPIADELIENHVHLLANHYMVATGTASKMMREAVVKLKNLRMLGSGALNMKKADDIDDQVLAALDDILAALDRYDNKNIGKVVRAGDTIVVVDDVFDKFNPHHDQRGQFASGDGSPTDIGIKANVMDKADEIKKYWIKQSKFDTTDKIVNAAAANQFDLANRATNIAKGMEGVRFVNPGQKSRDSLQRKIDDGRSPQKITDAVRGGFIVKSPEQVDQLISKLGRNYQVVDEGWAVTQASYFDRKAIVRFRDGQMGEIQFWHQSMLEKKEALGHKLYEQARALKDGDQNKVLLNEKMKALYTDVMKGLSPVWHKAVREAYKLAKALLNG